LEEEDEIALQTEVDILSQLDHPNVVKLYEIFDERDVMYLVLELMTGGEVHILVHLINVIAIR
jgi:calcium/calmodulin-dependent protein kinase I